MRERREIGEVPILVVIAAARKPVVLAPDSVDIPLPATAEDERSDAVNLNREIAWTCRSKLHTFLPSKPFPRKVSRPKAAPSGWAA